MNFLNNDKNIRKIIKKTGHYLSFHPLYSSDLNSIEKEEIR
ncbi:hypothetical protein HMPREF1552_01720 [Leptotrichia sp. oral taxon 879 str. F0557]|nr:hypothetical protein HMPREF1552_01720 [Leptotrichia sp. oral taxon 879 str. F0557]